MKPDHADGAERGRSLGAAPGETPFYIQAPASTSRPRRVIKHDDTFAVLDTHGDIGATGGTPDGLFHLDTRHLSHLELTVDGAQPLLLGSAVRDDNLSFSVDLTNPDLFRDGKLILMKDTIHIARTIYLFGGSLRDRIVVSNHGADPVRMSLAIAFAADFADIFEVRGTERRQRGHSSITIGAPDHVALNYTGLDGVTRKTGITFEPTPDALHESLARYDLALPAGAQTIIFVVASSQGRQPSTVTYFKGLANLHRLQKAAKRHAAKVETANRVVAEILFRASSDLYMLISDTEDGPYPYAGIPWYSTSFGRDGLITAYQMLWFDPSIAKGVLTRLARLQAVATDAHADAEPGKILHEMRSGEMASLGEVPFRLYYGSVDATPLFLMTAGAYLERTRDVTTIRDLWPALGRAMSWVDAALARDDRGFLSYARAQETGLANQGWKDSYDAVFHHSGALAEGPIALVEVQGYVFAALKAYAACATAIGEEDVGRQRRQLAETFRRRFEDAFWSEALQTYALALDGAGRRCEVRTSNAAHVLAAGIAAPDRAQRVIDDMFSPAFFSGWGIRTVAANEVRYNPMSYHNGSIWPHDNAMIGCGMARYGRKAEVAKLFDALMQASVYMEHRRIPELYCGFRRKPGRGPTLYPAACSPQAWAAGAPFMMLQSLLGLEFDPQGRSILLHEPFVPEHVGDVTVRNLQLGEASIDFMVKQHGKAVSVEIMRVDGDLQLSVIPQTSRL